MPQNKKQYRGALDAPGVIRGICAAFPEGTEPSMCNENWVSDNECTEGSEGWLACNSGWVQEEQYMQQNMICGLVTICSFD